MPDAHLHRASPAVAPGAEQEPERTAALREADVLEWSEFIGRRGDERGAGEPASDAVRGQNVAGDDATGLRDGERGDAGGSPGDKVPEGE